MNNKEKIIDAAEMQIKKTGEINTRKIAGSLGLDHDLVEIIIKNNPVRVERFG